MANPRQNSNPPLGAHKWRHYFAISDELFSELRSRAINLLEIGIYNGASAHVWRQLFHPEARIVGIDINPDCAKLDDPSNNLHIRIGSQEDENFLANVVAELGPFDLIIDDGSHITSNMIKTFKQLFEYGLKDHGLYFVEDVHTNFWFGWRDVQRSFLYFLLLAGRVYACALRHGS